MSANAEERRRSRARVRAALNLPVEREQVSSGSSVSSGGDPGLPPPVDVLDWILMRLRERLDGLTDQEQRRMERLQRTQESVARLTGDLERLEEVRAVLARGGPPEINQMPIAIGRALRREMAELLLGAMVETGLELPDERRGRLRRVQLVHGEVRARRAHRVGRAHPYTR